MAENQGHLTALATPDVIAKEALRQLWNESEFIKKTYRDHETEFKGKRVGDTVNVRKPQRFLTNRGRVLADDDYQNLYEGTIPLKIDYQWNVPIQYTTNDKSLTIKDFSNRSAQARNDPIGGGYRCGHSPDDEERVLPLAVRCELYPQKPFLHRCENDRSWRTQ